MQTNVHIRILWLRPSQRTSQDDSCGVNIAVQFTTTGTAVPALGKSLRYSGSALRAILGRVGWGYGHHRDAGSFSLVSQDAPKLAPASVGDCSGQPVVLDHVAHGQVFHRDEPVATHETKDHVVVVFPSEVGDVYVAVSKLCHGLSPAVVPLPFASDRTPEPSKLGQGLFQVARVGLFGAIRCLEERREPDVDAHRWVVALGDWTLTEIAHDEHVPLTGLSLERERFDCSFDKAVGLHAQSSDVLDAKSGAGQPDAIAMGWELDGVKTISSLEPGVAWLCSALQPSEEGPEGSIEPAHRCLGRREVNAVVPDVDLALGFEPSRLIPVANRELLGFVGGLALREAGVVESPMRLDHRRKHRGLPVVGPDAELGNRVHELLPFLAFDVATNRRFGYGSNAACVVAAAPERWQSRAERSELFSQLMRASALEATDQLSDASSRIRLDEQVNVVGHDLQCVDCSFEVESYRPEDLAEPILDATNENFTAILRAPHEVVLERKEGTSVLPVAFGDHVSQYSAGRQLVKKQHGGRASSVA